MKMTVAYNHRRSARRVEDAKRKARPELNHFGWDTLGLAQKFVLPDFQDNILRVDGSKLSLSEFREKYETPRIPIILTGLTDKWQAHEKWTVSRIARKYRNQRFKCGEDDDGYSVKLKMKYYADYMVHNVDDSPLYIFDSGFGDRHKTKKLLDDFVVPHLFRDDLFSYADHKKRPPNRWFVMGPARSGTSIHIDPLGTSAWNSLIKGHKRWVLIAPDTPRTLVKPYESEKGKHPDEAITWFSTVYKRVRASTWPKEYPVIEARQGPGDTMFVPSGWWHVVINEDNTIAVTQNYCSVVNLPQVWPRTVKGRPKLSKHWFKRLNQERPELIPIMEQSMRGPPVNESSSDSSSSSSSSDDDTSSDDNTTTTVDCSERPRKRRYSEVVGHKGEGDACASKMRSSPRRH
uniref:JmjC domain-containing protein n=1 Tax=Haemonchus contortus TaxID=6289 RepID=A0A7I4YNY0_HAECO